MILIYRSIFLPTISWPRVYILKYDRKIREAAAEAGVIRKDFTMV